MASVPSYLLFRNYWCSVAHLDVHQQSKFDRSHNFTELIDATKRVLHFQEVPALGEVELAGVE